MHIYANKEEVVSKKNGGATVSMDDVRNAASEVLAASEPYHVELEIEGIADLFFHRWSCEDIEARAKAPKGSAAKKTDNLESYVWRNAEGFLCLPGEYLRCAIIEASRFQRDPSSPKANAQRIYKAGVIIETEMASLGKKAWDFEDKRRVVIQRQGVSRTRPCMRAGWRATFTAQVILPEYIDEIMFRETVDRAGKLIGVGAFRPTRGRFHVVEWMKL